MLDGYINLVVYRCVYINIYVCMYVYVAGFRAFLSQLDLHLRVSPKRDSLSIFNSIFKKKRKDIFLD